MAVLTQDEIGVLKELAQEIRASRAQTAQLTQATRSLDAKVSAGNASSPAEGAGRPPMRPRLGETVVYRARTRDYELPAIVTANVDTLDRRGVVRGDVPDITGEENVHLHVLTCGEQGSYQEHDIPYSRERRPGTWSWS